MSVIKEQAVLILRDAYELSVLGVKDGCQANAGKALAHLIALKLSLSGIVSEIQDAEYQADEVAVVSLTALQVDTWVAMLAGVVFCQDSCADATKRLEDWRGGWYEGQAIARRGVEVARA